MIQLYRIKYPISSERNWCIPNYDDSIYYNNILIGVPVKFHRNYKLPVFAKYSKVYYVEGERIKEIYYK